MRHLLILTLIACGCVPTGKKDAVKDKTPDEIVVSGELYIYGDEYAVGTYQQGLADELNLDLVDETEENALDSTEVLSNVGAMLENMGPEDVVFVTTGNSDIQSYGAAGASAYKEAIRALMLTVASTGARLLIVEPIRVHGWNAALFAPYNQATDELRAELNLPNVKVLQNRFDMGVGPDRVFSSPAYQAHAPLFYAANFKELFGE